MKALLGPEIRRLKCWTPPIIFSWSMTFWKETIYEVALENLNKKVVRVISWPNLWKKLKPRPKINHHDCHGALVFSSCLLELSALSLSHVRATFEKHDFLILGQIYWNSRLMTGASFPSPLVVSKNYPENSSSCAVSRTLRGFCTGSILPIAAGSRR